MFHTVFKGVILLLFCNTWSVSPMVVDSSKVLLHSSINADPDEHRNVVSIKIWFKNRDERQTISCFNFNILIVTCALALYLSSHYSYFFSVLIQPTAKCSAFNSKVPIKYHTLLLKVCCKKSFLVLFV